ncbi:MAG: SDR family NAD(P)-dependent oxidoreductase [Burkholderiaceae bacterium]
MKIDGQHVLVTGGASGLGRGTVALFAAAGCPVSIVDLDTPSLHETAASCGATPYCCDVSDGAAMERVFAAAVALHGPPRIVVTCAGIALTGPVLRRDGAIDIDQFIRTIEVNLVGTFNALRLAAFHLRDSAPWPASGGDTDVDGERGVFVTTSSIAAEEGQGGQSAYVASKGAVASMTLPIARELGASGIRIVSIEPGVFETPMTTTLPQKSRAVVFGMRPPFPYTPGRPAHYAALVRSIVENPMLNGTVIRLDGALRLPAK